MNEDKEKEQQLETESKLSNVTQTLESKLQETEQKLRAAEEKCQGVEAALKETEESFRSYKLRAHTALKKRDSTPSESDNELTLQVIILQNLIASLEKHEIFFLILFNNYWEYFKFLFCEHYFA